MEIKNQPRLTFRLLILIVISFFLVKKSNTQINAAYSIDTFTIKYDTLTNYNSIVLENLIDREQWTIYDREFDLGFEFPFFETSFSTIEYESYGTGIFKKTQLLEWYNLYMLDNDWHICDDPNKLTYTKYDYRYKKDIENGFKVFKLEWHDVCLRPSNNKFSRPYNYQVWLWENGNIDFLTGSLIKNDTTIFKDEVGFVYDDINWGGIGIVNPENTYALFYEGDYKKPNILQGHPDSILYFDRSTIKTLPHEGFVIRFKKSTTSVHDVKNRIPIPNIVSDELIIPEDIIFSQYQIFDTQGALLKQGQERSIATNNLHNGLYIIRLMNGKEVWTYKLLKQ